MDLLIFSPWSRRVLTKVSGQWRFGGTQIYPGDSAQGIDLVNLYSPYWRRITAHSIYK